LDNLEVLGRLADYLLIRLITVFDPAFLPGLFLVFSLLQANEVWCVARCFRMALMISVQRRMWSVLYADND
uniref:hypothetical protein n=1 Tax=Pseudomonas viridiflava TaxID=33069 RepID=UPI0019800CB2